LVILSITFEAYEQNVQESKQYSLSVATWSMIFNAHVNLFGLSTNAILATCNCLESVFNDLRTTTQRTNMCHYCKVHIPIRQIKVCSGCKDTRYCSPEVN
jgi:hypothetical protein